MNYARMAVAKANGQVEAAAHFPNGTIMAKKFDAQLMVFEKFSGSPSMGTLRPITGEIVEVFNILDEEIEAGSNCVIGQTIDETWVVECIY